MHDSRIMQDYKTHDAQEGKTKQNDPKYTTTSSMLDGSRIAPNGFTFIKIKCKTKSHTYTSVRLVSYDKLKGSDAIKEITDQMFEVLRDKYKF